MEKGAAGRGHGVPDVTVPGKDGGGSSAEGVAQVVREGASTEQTALEVGQSGVCEPLIVPELREDPGARLRRQAGVGESLPKFEDLAHLFQGEVQRLHLLDEQKTLNRVLGVQTEAALTALGIRQEVDFFVVPDRPEAESGAFGHVADLHQGGAYRVEILPHVLTLCGVRRPSGPVWSAHGGAGDSGDSTLS